MPTIPKSELMAHREGLIIGSACEAGELFKAVVDHKDWDELKRIASFYDYLEIQPLCNNAFMLRNGEARARRTCGNSTVSSSASARNWENPSAPPATSISGSRRTKCTGISCWRPRSSRTPTSPCPSTSRPLQEMLEEFQYLGEEKAYEVVVTNTRLVADQIETFELLPAELFPPRLEKFRGGPEPPGVGKRSTGSTARTRPS